MSRPRRISSGRARHAAALFALGLGLGLAGCRCSKPPGADAGQSQAEPATRTEEPGAGAAQSGAPASDARRPPPADRGTSDKPPPPPNPETARSVPTPAATDGAVTPKRAYHIAVLGDSISDPRVAGGGYLNIIKERCPESHVYNFAKGGWMVNQMRRAYAREVAEHPAPLTHLIVFGGVNDLYSDLTAGRSVEKITGDLMAIYEAGRARGLLVVGFTVAPWGGFTRYYNERRAGTTRQLNTWILEQQGGALAQVIDAHALLLCGSEGKLCERYERRIPDGLHPGSEGHKALGEALFQQALSGCR